MDGTTFILIILILFSLPSLFSTIIDKAPRRPKNRPPTVREYLDLDLD